jgi:hypothetical protein
MTEFNGAMTEEAKVMVITKIVLNLMKEKAYRIHRPLKFIAFGDSTINSANNYKTYRCGSTFRVSVF